MLNLSGIADLLGTQTAELDSGIKTRQREAPRA